MMDNSVYQPIVIKRANSVIRALTKSKFFSDNDIKDTGFTLNYLCDILTAKFIDGELEEDLTQPVFEPKEEIKILSEIITGSRMESLKKKGVFDSIEDENGEELFFLTPLGENILNEIQTPYTPGKSEVIYSITF